MGRLAASMGASLLAVACSGRDGVDFVKPKAPDMSAVVATYESPDGTFDEATAPATLSTFGERFDRIGQLGLQDELIGSVQKAIEEVRKADESGFSTSATTTERRQQGLSLDADGTMRITRICDGWGPEPVPDKKANGYLELNVNFSERGLDPIVWGDAVACRYLVGGAGRILIDEGTGRSKGDVRLHIGENIELTGFGTDPIIVDVDLATDVAGTALDASFDFRLDLESRALEIAVETPTGSVVLEVAAESVISIRARNGNFRCDVDGGACVTDTGETFAL